MMPTCCAPAARPGCSTRCTPPRRWGSSCASSPSGTPTSSPRWVARIWWRSQRGRRCCPGIEERAFLDIDSLLRPVYGHAKQGASFGHAKIASRALLRLGLSPQITTLSTATAPPVIAEARLRSGKAGSGRGRRLPRSSGPSLPPARAGAPATIMLRGDSAFGTKKVIAACCRGRRRVLPVGEPQSSASPPPSRASTRPPTPRCTTQGRSTTPTPGH